MPKAPHLHGDHSPAGDLPGLRFALRPESPAVEPRLVVEAMAGRIIVRIDGNDHLFARAHPHFQGVHVGIAPRAAIAALPPIHADDVRTVERAAREGTPHAWARWFAGVIAGSHLFAPGDHAITEAQDGSPEQPHIVAGAAPSSLVFLEPVTPCLSAPTTSWLDWFGDDRDVLRLRTPSPPDAARVKAWRKRARDGTLPPVLLWFVAGLDTCVLLDGHDRLLAAREEGVAPRLLVLWRYTTEARAVCVARQQGLLEELHTRRENPTVRRPAVPTDQENRLLLEAFPPPVRLHPTTRAVALRGGAAAFAARARAALWVDVDERFLAGREPAGESTGCSVARCGADLGWAPGS